MRLRGIPLQTCITLAREGKLKSKRNIKPSDTPQVGKRGRMRRQVSRKPFEEKLLYLQDELREITQFIADGFNTSKLEIEIKGQIERISQFLGYVYI